MVVGLPEAAAVLSGGVASSRRLRLMVEGGWCVGGEPLWYNYYVLDKKRGVEKSGTKTSKGSAKGGGGKGGV